MKSYRKYEKRKCAICGCYFSTRKDSKTSHCSMKCAASSRKRKNKICKMCGKEYNKRGSSKFCSRECYSLFMSEKIEVNCKECGKILLRSKSQIRNNNFCSRDCMKVWQSKERRKDKSSRWNGGKTKESGYIFLLQDDGSYKQEHRIVVENAIGRQLTKDEVIHHINGMKTDNRIENLAIMSRSDHARLHKLKEKDK